MRGLALLVTLLLPAVAGAAEQLFIAHPSDAKKHVELYISRPPGKERLLPAVVIIHGHQGGARPGAGDIAGTGRLDQLAASGGFVAVAVSQPGYGKSDGPPDYCGPFTQQAVLAALRHVRTLPGVDPKRVALLGVSRGAVVAAMVAAADPDLAAVVLVVPVYDLGKTYARLRELEHTVEEVRGIADNIAAEAGTTPAAFAARSPLAVAAKIRAPTLILAGAKDPRILPDDPYLLAERISENGVPARAVVFAELGHSIPLEQREPVIDEFLKKRLASPPRPLNDRARPAMP